MTKNTKIRPKNTKYARLPSRVERSNRARFSQSPATYDMILYNMYEPLYVLFCEGHITPFAVSLAVCPFFRIDCSLKKCLNDYTNTTATALFSESGLDEINPTKMPFCRRKISCFRMKTTVRYVWYMISGNISLFLSSGKKLKTAVLLSPKRRNFTLRKASPVRPESACVQNT